MDKATEIKKLRELATGDTYFAQFFGADIEQMAQNITNDFPIEMGCKFNQRADKLSEELAQQKRMVELNNRAFAMAVLTAYGNTIEDVPLRVMVQAALGGRLGLIKAKRTTNVELTQDDIDFLIQQASYNK